MIPPHWDPKGFCALGSTSNLWFSLHPPQPFHQGDVPASLLMSLGRVNAGPGGVRAEPLPMGTREEAGAEAWRWYLLSSQVWQQLLPREGQEEQ